MGESPLPSCDLRDHPVILCYRMVAVHPDIEKIGQCFKARQTGHYKAREIVHEQEFPPRIAASPDFDLTVTVIACVNDLGHDGSNQMGRDRAEMIFDSEKIARYQCPKGPRGVLTRDIVAKSRSSYLRKGVSFIRRLQWRGQYVLFDQWLAIILWIHAGRAKKYQPFNPCLICAHD